MAAAAFPAFHVTGAVHHYIKIAGASQALYLGTCESTPQVSFKAMSKPVMNDTHGPMLPAQKVDCGEMAVIGAALNYFSKSTYATMLAATNPARAGRFSRGLLKFGRTTVQLWQVFENALNAQTRAAYPGLELGFYWPQVEVVAKDWGRMGTQDQLTVLTGEAYPYFVPQTSASTVLAGEREFVLYSQADVDFPAEVLVPQ